MKILNINNTKVVYHYLPSKLTNIQILTNVGSISEDKDQKGLAHILEHCFFLGSKKRPGKMDIQTNANDMGGKLNAYTSLDITNYHISVLNDFFSEGFDILADMYQNPLFPEDEFKKEINPILSEMRRGQDDAGSVLYQKVAALMVGEDAGHPIIGTEESIKAATIDGVKAFRSKFYGGENVMISIVGGVKEDEVISVVSSLFTSPPSSSLPIIPQVEYSGGEFSMTKEGITEAIYTLYYPSLPRFHKDIYKQKMMTYVLGGNDSGMLHERIREELGLSCYGIFASQANFDSHNLIEVSTGIDPIQVDQCHDEVMGQIKKLMTEKVDDKRLARAKASLRTSIAAASENSSGYNGSISTAILKGATENPLEKLLEGVNTTTADDILEMANSTFNAQPYKGVCLPEIK